MFITRIRYNDTYGKTNSAGGAGEDWACAVCADPLYNVYFGGYFTNYEVNFGVSWGGNDIKPNAGQQDIFVTKLTYEQ